MSFLFVIPSRDRPSEFCSWTQLSPPQPSQLTFHQFPFLPTEIRLKIWSQAARIPRLVRFNQYQTNYANALSPIIHKCSNRIPAVLHVCSDSREVALKSYALLFPDNDPSAIGPFPDPSDLWRTPLIRPKPFYLNYAVDTFQCDSKRMHSLQTLWPQDMQGFASVKRLAMSTYSWAGATISYLSQRYLPIFRAAEEVALVVMDSNGHDLGILRASNAKEVLEWSEEDRRLVILRIGKMVEKFREEFKQAIGRDWRPNISVKIFINYNLIEILS